MHFSKALALLALPIFAMQLPTLFLEASRRILPLRSLSLRQRRRCRSARAAPAACGAATQLRPRTTPHKKIFNLLGVVVQGVDVLVGLDCDEISVASTEGGAWYV